MEEKMIDVFNLLTMLTAVTNAWESEIFGAFYCMLLEEWCRSNGEEIVPYITNIANAVKAVNEENGSY